MRAKSEYPIRHADQHMPDGSDPMPKVPIYYDFLNVGDWLSVEVTDGGGLLSRAMGWYAGPTSYHDMEWKCFDGTLTGDMLLSPYNFDVQAQQMNFSTLDSDVGGGGGGIALQAQTTITLVATQPGSGNILFDTQGQFYATMNDWNMIGTGSQVIDFSGQTGGANQQDYDGSWTVRADGLASTLDMDTSGDINITPANDFLANPVAGDVNIQVPTGKTFTIKNHTGFPQIQWTEGDTDVHIPSGGNIVADL